MYPWRRILIPTDFSTASSWSFDTAVHLAGTTGAELIILHIRMTRASHPDELRFPADDALYAYAEEIELQRLRDHARRRNATVPTRLVVRKGSDPGKEICAAALEESADLIVIATHARHHVAHLLIGSTTMTVLSTPPSPVLAVRYGIRPRLGLHRIVVPVHAGQNVLAAAQLAAAIAQRQQSEVHLVMVCSETDRPKAEERLEEVEKSVFRGVSSQRAVIRGSDVEKEVLRYSESVDADALFINAGTQEIGTTKQDLVRRASAPVMLVPV
jgi:nucleotide-binding universal stress UspA family protein